MYKLQGDSMQATITIPENYSNLPQEEKTKYLDEQILLIQEKIEINQKKQTAFPKFKAIPMKGKGESASEMVAAGQALQTAIEAISGKVGKSILCRNGKNGESSWPCRTLRCFEAICLAGVC